MDDLESRLEHQLSGLGRVPLAEPVPVDDLRRRARHVRVSRALTSVVATTTAIVVIAAVVIATRRSSETHAQKVQVAAPDFVLGDIDAVVLASSLDADGARNPVPVSLAATVARVPGVQIVSGVVDTFASRMTKEGGGTYPYTVSGVPPRTPILFTYHEGEDVALTAGRAPEAQNEIIVDADVLSRDQVKIGDTVDFGIRGIDVSFKIVGTFDLPGIDLTGIPLAALSAAHQPPDLQLDRLDVKFKPGVDATKVRDAIATAVGNYTVAQPAVISFPDQRLAQLEIQHAYWALLSPDANERADSGVGASNAQEKANYQKYADLATHVELRVENVAFLSADAAALTYRIYYGGSPSPIITDPQSGTATRVDGHWQLGTSTLCSLAALVGIKCTGANSGVAITPPNGWAPVSTLDPEIVHAFNTVANPDATVAERVATIAGGNTPAVRPMVESGVAHDRQYSGKATLTIAGWRSVAPTRIEVLYSLQTEGGPSTPWPSTAAAQKHFDGHWYVSEQFACGLSGLAGGSCSAPGTITSSGGSKASVSAAAAGANP